MDSGKILCALVIFMLTLFYPIFSCVGELAECENLMLQVSTNKSDYMVGEPILIRLDLVNPTNELVTLTFRSSKVFDGVVWIFGNDGEFFEEIYDASNCVFLPVITVIEIQAYSSYEILSLNYSSSLEPGIYVIKALSANQQSETTVEVHRETLPEFSQLALLVVMVASTFIALVYTRRTGRTSV